MGQANSSKRELSRGFKKTDGSSKLKPSGKKKTIADGLVHEYKAGEWGGWEGGAARVALAIIIYNDHIYPKVISI